MLRLPLSPTTKVSTGASGWEELPWLTRSCTPDPLTAS